MYTLYLVFDLNFRIIIIENFLNFIQKKLRILVKFVFDFAHDFFYNFRFFIICQFF